MKKESVNEIIGKIIRNARLDKRMTLKDLGKLIGYSEVATHNYEMGERGMSLETFFNICQILDLDVNEVQEQCRKTLERKANRENEK